MTSSIDIKDIQTPLIPQELWLIEAYIKPAYFKKMVDAWQRMVEIADDALEDYMAHIPSNYRSRHVSEQPDVVWGGRVLPNFRATLAGLQDTYICIKNGDLGTPNPASIRSDIRGASDYDHDWLKDRGLNGRMGFDVYAEFDKQQRKADDYSTNISSTFGAGWLLGELTKLKLYDMGRGYGIELPTEWPTYRLNPLFQCATGEELPKSGIYIPATGRSCANFLPLRLRIPNASTASVIDTAIPKGDDGYRTEANTIWTLVERVSDTGGGPVQCRIVPENEYYNDSTKQQSLPGEPNSVCPRSGTWQTPARLYPRSIKMQAGEKFPAVEHDTGGNGVVWFWVSE